MRVLSACSGICANARPVSGTNSSKKATKSCEISVGGLPLGGELRLNLRPCNF